MDDDDLRRVELRDFVLDPPEGAFPAIVANPPYIRRHRLAADVKERLCQFGHALTGTRLDGRAGYHVYFLLRALTVRAPGGRLAFIMPADTVEGVSGPPLWRWIAARYRLDGVVTFAPEATPFPGVDTNALVILICNAPPVASFTWARWGLAGGDAFREWGLAGRPRGDSAAVSAVERDVGEGLATRLSRPPTEE